VCNGSLVGGTEQRDAADHTLGWRDGRLEVDCCNSATTTRLAVDRTLVARHCVSTGWRVDGEHVHHRHHLVLIPRLYTDIIPAAWPLVWKS